MCVHSREVWTLGEFKQKWDLAYHARTKLTLKLQYEVEPLTVSKHSRAVGDFTYAHHIVSAGIWFMDKDWKQADEAGNTLQGWMTLGKLWIQLLKGWADPAPGRATIKQTKKHFQSDAIGPWPSASLAQDDYELQLFFTVKTWREKGYK